MTHHTEAERALSSLHHLYQQMAGGAVKDSAQAKRFAEGLLSPAIEKLEQAACCAPAPPVPQGWKLVPVKPTYGMLNAMHGICSANGKPIQSKIDAADHKYASMISAAPQPPEAAQGLDPDSVVRHLAIGRAIERVCVELPEWAEISISLEKGAGTITLIDWDGNEQENFPTDDGFAGTLNAAVDTAIAVEAAKQGEQP